MGEKLIEAVRVRPCLWDTADPDYKLTQKKLTAWKEVAELCGLARTYYNEFYLNF